MTFKEQLKKLIENRFLTQSKLAIAMGLKRQGFQYKIEHDSFSRNELNKISEILHLSDSELLDLIKCK